MTKRSEEVASAVAILRTMVCVRCEHYRNVGHRTCGLDHEPISRIVNEYRKADGTLRECPIEKW